VSDVAETPKISKTLRRSTVILLVVIVAIGAFTFGNRYDDITARFSRQSSSPSELDFSSLNEIYKVLRSKYDGTIDANKLLDGAKHGLVAAAGDPYTVYFNADESKAFDGDLNGSFEGIGAELGTRDSKLTVISTLDDSPAKKAGLQAGDIVTKVNDEDASGWSVDAAVAKIRGQKGTTVKITIVRGSDVKEIPITRDMINDPSVKSEITADNIGIMRISRFGESDTAQLSRAAAENFKAKGVKGVILDMRGNGGGYLTAAQDVSSLWLNDKVVVTERTNGKITDTLRSDKDAPLEGIPTTVLVDGGSASASEIVAGALSDNKAAKLVGAKTFGKGSVQTIVQIPTGGSLKVTIAKWYTPHGKNINKEGITPGVQVGMTADDVNAGRDPQKDKALQLLSQGL